MNPDGQIDSGAIDGRRDGPRTRDAEISRVSSTTVGRARGESYATVSYVNATDAIFKISKNNQKKKTEVAKVIRQIRPTRPIFRMRLVVRIENKSVCF